MHRYQRIIRAAISVAGAAALTLALLSAPATAATQQAPTQPTIASEQLASLEVAPSHTLTAATVAASATYRVRPGDTLGAIAQRFCGRFSAFPSLAAASRISNPNLIFPGQTITLSCSASRPTTPKASRSTTRTSSTGWLRPIAGGSCSSGFGPRWGGFHDGIDLAAPQGTRIRASKAGTVSTVAYEPGRAGWYVKVSVSGGWFYMDMHMKQRPPVRAGQHVTQGQTLGYVGQTGDATGPHVHIRVHHNGKAVNPAMLGLGC